MIYTKDNPSPEYIKLIQDYVFIHKNGTANKTPINTYNGLSTIGFADFLKNVFDKNKCKTLLDYGSGKGDRYFKESSSGGINFPPLKDYWNIEPTLFDPGVPHPKPSNGKMFDAVISIDVLEHIPLQDLLWVVEEIFSFAKDIVFINVACYSARATLPNGSNAHVSVQHPWWWCGFIHAIAQKRNIKTFLACAFKDQQKIKYLNYTINDDPKKYN